jgi:hypothetical protein
MPINGRPALAVQTPLWFPRFVEPAGGIWATTRDVLRHGCLHLDVGTATGSVNVVSPVRLLRMREPVIPVPGLPIQIGWDWVVQDVAGTQVFWRAGDTLGQHTDFVAIPEQALRPGRADQRTGRRERRGNRGAGRRPRPVLRPGSPRRQVRPRLCLDRNRPTRRRSPCRRTRWPPMPTATPIPPRPSPWRRWERGWSSRRRRSTSRDRGRSGPWTAGWPRWRRQWSWRPPGPGRTGRTAGVACARSNVPIECAAD